MNNLVLLGQENQILSIPQSQWKEHIDQAPEHVAGRLNFMSAAHHQVRYFVVRELPRWGRPLSPPFIAEQLGLPLRQVNTILAELEQHLFFLTRNDSGAVAWAYPVTADPTPHQVVLSTGEQTFAA
jgi:hypothetical protein